MPESNENLETTVEESSKEETSLDAMVDSENGGETTAEAIVDSGSGEEPAIETAVDSGSGEEPAIETAVDSGSGEEPAIETTVDSGSGEEPAKESTVDNKSVEKPHVNNTADSKGKPTEKLAAIDEPTTVDEEKSPIKHIMDGGSKLQPPANEYPCFNHHHNLCFKDWYDPYCNSHYATWYHTHNSGNTVIVPYGWKGNIPVVKAGGHVEFFDFNKPADLGCCNIFDCY